MPRWNSALRGSAATVPPTRSSSRRQRRARRFAMLEGVMSAAGDGDFFSISGCFCLKLAAPKVL
jgi:hypothetical protein